MSTSYPGVIATVALSVSHIILAVSIFIMGRDGTLIGIFLSLTTILAGLAGYRLKKFVDTSRTAREFQKALAEWRR